MKFITAVLLSIAALLPISCGWTGAVASGVVTGARIFARVVGTQSEREMVCKYYNEHREEIDAVREYYKASWERVPEKDKPALLRINEQLTECDATTVMSAPAKRTTARALLDAFKRAVEIYRELKAAGVL